MTLNGNCLPYMVSSERIETFKMVMLAVAVCTYSCQTCATVLSGSPFFHLPSSCSATQPTQRPKLLWSTCIFFFLSKSTIRRPESSWITHLPALPKQLTQSPSHYELPIFVLLSSSTISEAGVIVNIILVGTAVPFFHVLYYKLQWPDLYSVL